ncbi:MAG: DNA-binding transcriptional regulator, MerR family [Pelagibacterales bacterium]|jgi:DNA-binding transcriptional MerR regulator|nr:DNA-binding transcriptional regulator, MerR family [Pelagibacterales bacterium]
MNNNLRENKERLINISDLAKRIGLINRKNGKPLTHTLRFWEKNFHQIKPIILPGNRRYYSKKIIDIITLIKFLLKDKGLTIKGAKLILNNKVNNLDDYQGSSIKAEYYKKKIKLKSNQILQKLKKLNGKKNTS